MTGIAETLQHLREKQRGIGTNSQAAKYLNQDYEALRQHCFQSGCLFQDDAFPALPSSLGFDELGPGSYKIRGVSWQRPTVSYHGSVFKVRSGTKLLKNCGPT